MRLREFAMNPDTTVPLVRALMNHRQTQPAADRFTAIAAYNDYMAATVIRCVQAEYGLRVPHDERDGVRRRRNPG